jgi:hypothetical protein
VVVDISNPASPTRVGAVTLATGEDGGRSIAVSGRYAYILTYTSPARVVVVDISNPASPTRVGAVTLATGENYGLSIAVSGRYAYILTYTSPVRVVVVDISNPASPTRVGAVTLATDENYGFSIAVSGRYAYILTGTSPARVVVVDISNPASPTRVGAVTLATGENSGLSIAVSGRYAYISTFTSPARVVVVDISNPASPTRVGAVTLATGEDYSYSIAVSGRYAYILTYTSPARVVVVDIRGIETSSLMAHSLEAGSLQIRKDLTVYDHLKVGGGINVGAGGLFSAGSISGAGGAYFAGNVGIGTTNPVARLYVAGTAYATQPIIIPGYNDNRNVLMGHWGNVLYRADKRYTVTLSSAPTGGSLSGLFDSNPRAAVCWDNTTWPVTIEVDWTSGPAPIGTQNRIYGFAMSFIYQHVPQSITIQTFDDNDNDGIYSWNTRYSKTGNTDNVVFSAWGWINKVQKVRAILDQGSSVSGWGICPSQWMVYDAIQPGNQYALDIGGGRVFGGVIIDGNVGIGTTAPSTRLAVDGLTSSQAGRTICSDTSGNFYYYAGSCVSSSIKYKTNIQNLGIGLETLLKLRPVTFEFKKDYGGYDGTTHMGFIAEEVEKVSPLLVDYNNGEVSGVRYNEMTALIVKSIQEQQKEIEDLKKEVDELKRIITR